MGEVAVVLYYIISMNTNPNEEQIAKQVAEEYTQALNRQIEDRFRAALLTVDPRLDMSQVTVTSNVDNDNELTVDGVDDETIDQAMAILEQEQ